MRTEIWWWTVIPLLFIALFLLNMWVFSGENKGAKLYQAHCASCHGEKGEGLRQLIPPLNKADFLAQHPEQVACIIRHGMEGPIVVNGVEYNHPMPANPKLSDIEIASLVEYIFSAWDNRLPKRSLAEVRRDLQQCNGK